MYYGSVCSGLIYFGLYKSIKPYLLEIWPETIALMISSLVADVGSYFIYYPLDCHKT